MLNKRFYCYAAVLLVLAVLAFNPPRALVHALGPTDVVARFAKTTFPAMIAALPRPPEGADGAWTIEAPDGSARFSWRGAAADDWSARLSVPLEPFVRAGLQPGRLPAGIVQGERMVFAMSTDAGAWRRPVTAGRTAVDDFTAFVDANRDELGYHAQLDHFGFELGGGNMFEWARDMAANDKDMVFVLDPAILLQAGVDQDAVEGWVYGTVIVDDEYGRAVPVEKFLKPFDLTAE